MEKENNNLVKLTIGILVSNRIRYIRNVMEGIRPLLENIPSELIALDTKGAEGDGSIEIVKEYTKKIYPFVWCNDFAKARNTILEHARGEWFLVLDDDEVLDNVQELISFLSEENSSKYESGSFVLQNYDADGEYVVSNVIRLFRRREGTRFVGAVHEYVNDLKQPTRAFSTVIKHYGYAFKTLDEAQEHQKRNVSILWKELEKKGYTPHLCAQMTQELIYLESSTEEGLAFANKAISILGGESLLREPAAQYILFATVLYHLRKGETEQAIKQINSLTSNYPLLEITKLVLRGISAELALAQKDIISMMENAEQYIELWDWKQKHETEAAEQAVFCFPQYYTEEYYYRMLHIAAAAANELEYFKKAQNFWKRFCWQTEGVDASQYQQDLKETIQGYKRVQALKLQYPEVMQRLELLVQAESELTNIERQEENGSVVQEYKTLMTTLIKNVYVILQALLKEDSEGLLMLKKYMETSSGNEISKIKTIICQECRELLQKNDL